MGPRSNYWGGVPSKCLAGKTAVPLSQRYHSVGVHCTIYKYISTPYSSSTSSVYLGIYLHTLDFISSLSWTYLHCNNLLSEEGTHDARVGVVKHLSYSSKASSLQRKSTRLFAMTLLSFCLRQCPVSTLDDVQFRLLPIPLFIAFSLYFCLSRIWLRYY